MSGAAVLPYDAEVEYLQGDGSAYINTGVYASTNLRAIANVDLRGVPASGASFIFSSRIGYNSLGFGVVFNGTSYITNPSTFRFDLGNANQLSRIVTPGQCTVMLDAPNRQGVIEGFATYNLSSSDFSNYIDIILFGLNSHDTITPQEGMRIQNYKVYDDNILIQDMIAVRVGSVGYMYDRVSGGLFGNAGEGAFILGADV